MPSLLLVLLPLVGTALIQVDVHQSSRRIAKRAEAISLTLEEAQGIVKPWVVDAPADLVRLGELLIPLRREPAEVLRSACAMEDRKSGHFRWPRDEIYVAYSLLFLLAFDAKKAQPTELRNLRGLILPVTGDALSSSWPWASEGGRWRLQPFRFEHSEMLGSTLKELEGRFAKYPRRHH